MVACSSTKMVYEKKFAKKVPWKVNFLTLTFHENFQDDNLARKALSRWIEVAKYRWQMNHYIWKAEPQERGAIHFHLSSNAYIPHQELRYTWNRELRKLGLNNINDNSTDIHAGTQIKNIESYMADYLCNEEKHAGRRAISGKLWGCSQNLSSAGKKYLLIKTEELKAITDELEQYSLQKKILAEGKEPPKFLDFNGYWILPNDFYKKLPDCELKTQYFEELEQLKQKPQKQLFPLQEIAN